MKLICLPFAGGDFTYFYRFKKYLDTEFDMVELSLNSRGGKISVPNYQSFSEMLEDIFSQINIPDDEDYVLFGHSMGGLLSFELYYKLIEKYKRPPKKIFISACRPPNLIVKKTKVPDENQSNRDYMAEIVKLGGTPAEILDYPDLVDLLAPVLKQDFHNIGNYNFHEKACNIDCPVTVLFGTKDSINKEDIDGWKQFVQNKFDAISFKGDHFFISDHVEEIAKMINEQIVA